MNEKLNEEDKQRLIATLQELVASNDLRFSRIKRAVGEIYVTRRGSKKLHALGLGIQTAQLTQRGKEVREDFNFEEELGDPFEYDLMRCPEYLVTNKFGVMLGNNELTEPLRGARHVLLSESGRQQDETNHTYLAGLKIGDSWDDFKEQERKETAAFDNGRIWREHWRETPTWLERYRQVNREKPEPESQR